MAIDIFLAITFGALAGALVYTVINLIRYADIPIFIRLEAYLMDRDVIRLIWSNGEKTLSIRYHDKHGSWSYVYPGTKIGCVTLHDNGETSGVAYIRGWVFD